MDALHALHASRWLVDPDLKLALESGLYSIKQIATRHNRTEGEIRLRKQELGLGQTFNTMNPQLANVFINKAVDRRLIHNTMH